MSTVLYVHECTSNSASCADYVQAMCSQHPMFGLGTHDSQCRIVSQKDIIRTQSCTHSRLEKQFLVTGNTSSMSSDKLYWEPVVSVLPPTKANLSNDYHAMP